MLRKSIAYALTVGTLLVGAATNAGETFTYSANGTTLKGYIARPAGDAGSKLHGGVLVVHEWWGQNDYPRRRADMLAELGYTAMALDMYGGGKTADHPKDAGKFAGEVRKNMDVGEKRFRAALEVLKSQPWVDATKIGAIGYCFGGGLVLEMARRGLPLAAVASFHGSLGGLSPISAGGVGAKVLVLNGADDPFIKPHQIEAFKRDMDAAGADYRFINYPGAVHGFSNPDATENGKKFNLPLAYDQRVDNQSWNEMKLLFERTLQ